MPPSDTDFVSVQQCRDKHAGTITREEYKQQHRGLVRQVSIIFTVLGLLMVGVGWVFNASAVATGLANDVQRSFEVHEAKQDEHLKHLDETLKRIEQIGQDIKVDVKEQGAIIDKLYRESGGR